MQRQCRTPLIRVVAVCVIRGEAWLSAVRSLTLRAMSFLVQLLLPLYNNQGRPFDAASRSRIRQELAEKFGGVTAYTRAPAEGTWEDPSGRTHRDDIVIVEVMTEALDSGWWKAYVGELANRLGQEELVARAMTFESLSTKVVSD